MSTIVDHPARAAMIEKQKVENMFDRLDGAVEQLSRIGERLAQLGEIEHCKQCRELIVPVLWAQKELKRLSDTSSPTEEDDGLAMSTVLFIVATVNSLLRTIKESLPEAEHLAPRATASMAD